VRVRQRDNLVQPWFLGIAALGAAARSVDFSTISRQGCAVKRGEDPLYGYVELKCVSL